MSDSWAGQWDTAAAASPEKTRCAWAQVFHFLHERFILSDKVLIQNFVSVLEASEKPVQVGSCLTINKPVDCYLVIVGVVL